LYREALAAVRKIGSDGLRGFIVGCRVGNREWVTIKEEAKMSISTLDWSQCPAVESIPGKVSGAWVFKGTRTPVSLVFENLQDMSVDELIDEYGVTREQVRAVLQFAAQSLEKEPTYA
jgi:uncharacterized protein (DUF433 family)